MKILVRLLQGRPPSPDISAAGAGERRRAWRYTKGAAMSRDALSIH
jgi:hypothetical protein